MLDDLEQWLATFLTLRPFTPVPHTVVTPKPENYLHCHITTVILPLLCMIMSISDTQRVLRWPLWSDRLNFSQRGRDPWVENQCCSIYLLYSLGGRGKMSKVQDPPQLPREFKASLRYMETLFGKKKSVFWIKHFLFMHMLVSVWACATCVQVLWEARRRRGVPWSWGWVRLWAAAVGTGTHTQVPEKSRESVSPTSLWGK